MNQGDGLALFLLRSSIQSGVGGKVGSRSMAARKWWGNHSQRHGQAGFQLIELVIIVAIIGLLAAISVPFLVSYMRATQLKGSAETVASWLNQGRQLAIRSNQSICANVNGSGMHYRIGGCAGALWIGSGVQTNSSGYVPLPAGITLSVTAPPIFNYLGAATPAATYTISHAGRTTTVTVSATGRISIP